MSHKAQIILQGATGVLIVAIACIIHAVQPWPNEAQASGRDAMTVNIIDAATLRAMLDRDDVVLIDNRPKEKFSGLGYIPGAINLMYKDPYTPGNVMTENLLRNVAKDKIIVFYCTGNLRAYYAAMQAIQWGFDPDAIFWYKGGYRDWVKQGF